MLRIEEDAFIGGKIEPNDFSNGAGEDDGFGCGVGFIGTGSGSGYGDGLDMRRQNGHVDGTGRGSPVEEK